MRISIITAEAMEQLGRDLAAAIVPGVQVHLKGELGAGKTTLVRGLLRGLRHAGKVKSPTYTLVEPYQLGDLWIYHFDFYRVRHPAEIENMGFRDYRRDDAICLIEWPEKAEGSLGEPDLEITIQIQGQGRELVLKALSERGKLLISHVRTPSAGKP
jgi:tRNA threonylcarbamoyladenosine biosynthesis protein TsaE